MDIRRLGLIVLAACGGKPAVAPPKLDNVTAEAEWMGPSSFTLVDGATTWAVVFNRPSGWTTVTDDHHALIASAAGSSVELGLAGGAPTCTATLVDADAVYRDSVTAQCAKLESWHEPDPSITWGLEVAPDTVALADLASVTLRFTAHNNSAATTAPPRFDLSLTIDGADFGEFGMDFGNGGMDGRWMALPPGETVDDERQGLPLTDRAGDHVLVLMHLGHEVARTTLHVR